MNSLINFFNKNNAIAGSAFLISILLSPWQYLPWRLINSDGIFYLHIAEQINLYGAAAAFQIYNWPFLPMFIAGLQKLLHVSYTSAAFLLDALLFGYTALFFVKIIEVLGGNKRTLWLATLVVLTFPPMITYRVDIFKDIGYWAFFLAGTYYLLRFLTAPTILFGLFWFFCSISAALFRIEGLVFFALGPLILWIMPGYSLIQRCKNYIKLYFPIVLSLPFLLLFILIKWQYAKTFFDYISLYSMSVVKGHLGNFIFWHQFIPLTNLFRDHFLPHTAKTGSATIILFTGLSCYFIYKIIKVLGILNFILIIMAQAKAISPLSKHALEDKMRAVSEQHRGILAQGDVETGTQAKPYLSSTMKFSRGAGARVAQQQTWLLVWLLFLTFIIPYNFLLQNLFINTRYLSSGTLLLLLFVPFALNYCFMHPQLALSQLWTRASDRFARYFNLRNLAIFYCLIAGLSLCYLVLRVSVKNIFSQQVPVAIWLDQHKKELSYACSTNPSLLFIVTGPALESRRAVTSHINLLLAPETYCQYIIFQTIPKNAAQLTQLQQAPGWVLYKNFQTSPSDKGTYIYYNTQFDRP